ncbi:hypothetical protein RV15_GL002764 [Enterococcus silesiacus]|uniref:DUF4829 domain-containing protein n=1 Tax=Enterococcus silesiacus TaxID=332949 RepID=A0AA91GKI9_9ENTE|nr:hypothetical protein RV15_GL002764 [Enterococcus silesiacus]
MWITVLLILVIGYSVSISGKKGKIENAVIIIGESQKFKDTEINSAIDKVKKEFKGFTNCEMTKLYYDEERSNKELENYFRNNEEDQKLNYTDKNDCIVLYSDFEVGLKDNQNSGFMPGSNHKGWIWLLKKDKFWKSWEIVTSGV